MASVTAAHPADELARSSMRELTPALRLMRLRQEELRAEVGEVRDRILENRAEQVVHAFAVRRGPGQRGPTSFAHRCQRPPSTRVLGRQLGPWDGTCYKERLLRSLSVRLHLKLCFAALKYNRNRTRVFEEVLRTNVASTRLRVKRLFFDLLSRELRRGREVALAADRTASSYIASRLLLPSLQRLGQHAIAARDQRGGLGMAGRFFGERRMGSALKRLSAYVATRRRFDPSRCGGEASFSTDASVTSEDSLDARRLESRPRRRRRVSFEVSEDRTDTSSSSGRGPAAGFTTLAEVCRFLKSKRFGRATSTISPSDIRSPDEMNVVASPLLIMSCSLLVGL